ncbi:hypothetical protein JMJ56_20780 [Belnapia sp. T18]|uniref:Uncharacterized protein n=1 Tax=Belnapia arida TaxID=2804533 RepID=A0ABS1U707_9PROT|nr:hypothetical protein [Belnapia arida]MBL6080457.1 hypothetical protein [Belnapia arida]
MTTDPVDPVALLTGTLAGLSKRQQAATLERVMQAYVRICQDAYPHKSLAEVTGQFGAIAEAATARLAEARAEAERRAATARLAKLMAAASAGSGTA